MKVLINRCFGGFGLSDEAINLYKERSGSANDIRWWHDDVRDDPILVDIVEELGERANSWASKLEIVDVPDGYDYWIEDYDGRETLHLKIRESHLRELIRLEVEDDIVNYVMKAV